MIHYENALKHLNIGDIDVVARRIADLMEKGGRIFTAGNGGSWCIAQHFAADLMKGASEPRRSKRSVIALGSNVAALTALSNDQSYHDALSYLAQWHGIGKKGDALIVFSVSGRSTNILRLMSTAHEAGAVIVAITGGRRFPDGWEYPRFHITVPVPPGMEREMRFCTIEGVFSCIAHEIARMVHWLEGLSDEKAKS